MRALGILFVAACSSRAAAPAPVVTAPVVAPPPPAKPDPDAVPFGPDDRAAELGMLRDFLRDGYAHLETKEQQWGFELPALYAKYEPKIRAADTWSKYESVMVKFVAELHDGHIQWRRKRAKSETRRKWLWLPLATQFAGNELIVTEVTPGGDAERAGIVRGDKIVAIDGVPVQQRIDALSALRSWSRIESARHEFAAAWRSSRQPADAPITARAITRELANGTQEIVKITPEEAKPRTKRPPFEVEWRGDVALLHVRTLGAPLAEMRKLGEQAAAAIMAKPKGLVVVLRGNDGGVEGGIRAVAQPLTSRAIVAATTRVKLSAPAREAHKAWKNLPEDPAKPGWSTVQPIEVKGSAQRDYPAKIAVVTDVGCESSCETLALALRAMGARLFGETTGGTSGSPIKMTLSKSGATVQIPARASFDSAGKPIEGYGVVPDEVIAPTRADLAAGRDVVLERALAYVCTKAPCT